MKPKKSKTKAKKRKGKHAGSKVISLTMDRFMKEKLDLIAKDSYADVATVCQVLLATGMHMGRNGADKALQISLLNTDTYAGRCQLIYQVVRLVHGEHDHLRSRRLFMDDLGCL